MNEISAGVDAEHSRSTEIKKKPASAESYYEAISRPYKTRA